MTTTQVPAVHIQPGDVIEISDRLAAYIGHPELTGKTSIVISVREYDHDVIGITTPDTGERFVQADSYVPVVR